LPQRPTAEAVFDVMRRQRPTIFYGVPTLYASLLAHKDMTRGARSDRLRLCISAGEPLPRALGERWRQASGVDVLDGIGSTEMFQTFLSNRPGDVRYGTTGKPVPGYDLKILDDQGREAADETRRHCRRRLLEPARQKPAHLCRRLDLHRRQIFPRPRRLLSLLRPH
jgi:acyl-coenzyme A synthetase/AMP-(fatty) acid ligase